MLYSLTTGLNDDPGNINSSDEQLRVVDFRSDNQIAVKGAFDDLAGEIGTYLAQ